VTPGLPGDPLVDRTPDTRSGGATRAGTIKLPDLLDHPFDHPDDPTGSHNVTDSLGKGDRVVILGQLRMRSWETPDGEQRSVVEVTAEEVAPSLRWATAKPERTARKANGNGEAKPAGEFNDDAPF
jgi:hypothetical protein